MVRVELLGNDLEVTDEAYAYLHAWLKAVPQIGAVVRVYDGESGQWFKTPQEPEHPVSVLEADRPKR